MNDIDSSNLVVPLARAGISFLRAGRDVHTHGVMQELRLVSPDDGSRFNWLIGAFYSTYRADIRGTLYIPSPDVLDYLTALLTLPVLEQLTANGLRSEEHTSELQSLMRKSYAVFCLKKKIIRVRD